MNIKEELHTNTVIIDYMTNVKDIWFMDTMCNYAALFPSLVDMMLLV